MTDTKAGWLDAALEGGTGMTPKTIWEPTEAEVEAAARALWVAVCGRPNDPSFDGAKDTDRAECRRLATAALRAVGPLVAARALRELNSLGPVR